MEQLIHMRKNFPVTVQPWYEFKIVDTGIGMSEEL